MNKFLVPFSLYILWSFSACQSNQEHKSEAGKFTITSPLLMDTSFIKEYVAEIQSLQNIEIHAKVKGYIESIHVDEGQTIKAGQVICTIRPKEYEAELLKAKSDVRTAELEVQNVKKLTDKNIVSQTELDGAVAKLDQAKAAEGIAELYVSYTKVQAPFNGTIDLLKFKMGSLIDEGTLLTTLSNNKEVYAYFNLSELEYLNFKTLNGEHSDATLILANNEPHKYPGKVEVIAGEFDKNTGSIAFRAKFPNPDFLLKHGQTGKVLLRNELKNAIVIPQKATFEVQDKIYVFVVNEQNVVQARAIITKQKLTNLYVIDQGLTINDKILLEGTQNVKDDDKIETIFIPAKEAIEKLQLLN
jgi:membrane fusion protein, multidrug efflux system